MTEAHLEICLGESSIPVGILHYTASGNREFSNFQYDFSWLEHPEAFALAPAFPLNEGKNFFRGDRPLPPFLMDTMPDSWGKKIFAMNARQSGSAEDLNSMGFLLAVSDFCRIGALRVRHLGANTQFLAVDQNDVLPKLYEIEEFCEIVRNIEQNTWIGIQ